MTAEQKRKRYSDAQIWDACEEIFQKENKPLEIWRVARAAGMKDTEIIEALLRETLTRGKPVQFRYPPLPCAAITKI